MNAPISPAIFANEKFDVEMATFATFTNQAINVKAAAEFITLCRGPLHDLFPYRMLLAGAGYARVQSIVVHHAIGINYPKSYLERLNLNSSVSAKQSSQECGRVRD